MAERGGLPALSLRGRLAWLGWLALINGLLAALFATSNLSLQGVPEDGLAQLFLALAFPGHFIALALLPVLLLWLVPGRQSTRSVAVLAFSAFLLLVAIDTQVFSLYRFHINSMVWNLLTGGAAAEIFVFDGINWLLPLAQLLALLLGQWWLAGWLWRRCANGGVGGGRLIGWLVFAVMVAGQALYATSDALQITSVTRQVQLLPWAQTVTIKRSLRRMGVQLPAASASVAPPRGKGLNYPQSPLQCRAETPDYNVLLVVSDGLRFDMVTPDVMPHTHALAERSWRFERHYSSGNSTRFGIFGLFYGLYGSYWHDALREGKSALLVDQFRDAGYRFGLFANARLTSPEFDRTVFASVTEAVPPFTEGDTVLAREERITEQMEAFVAEPDERPFFGFLFLDAPHAYVYPADGPAPFQPVWEQIDYTALGPDTDPLPFFNRYRNSLHYNDRLIARVLAALEDNGHSENTIVIVTGDHGQEFNESGLNFWGHNGNFSDWQVRVPLVVHWPGREPRVLDHRSSHVDLAPTLLKELFACSNPVAELGNGRHLLDDSPRGPVIASSWSRYGLLEEDRVTAYQEFGAVDVYDSDYRPLPEASPRSAATLQAIRDMSRFHAQ